MKFYEMEEGKTYKCIYNNGETSKFNHRIHHGFVECLRDDNAWIWIKDMSSPLALYGNNYVEIKKEIDWDKVPRMTPVRVKDSLENKWINRNFIILMKQDHDYPFACTDEKFNGISGWNYCEIIGEIKEEWYK